MERLEFLSFTSSLLPFLLGCERNAIEGNYLRMVRSDPLFLMLGDISNNTVFFSS